MTTKQILSRARALLENGSCQRTVARDGEGDGSVELTGQIQAWDAQYARAFDCNGAIFRVCKGGSLDPDVIRARAALSDVVGVPADELCWWNDASTKADVLKAFDEAIARES